jgi:hypothetical protein
MRKRKQELATIESPTVSIDPLDVNSRLYRQISSLLDELERNEDLTVRDKIAALVAIGRIQTIFMGLRKENRSSANAGSAVRKYASAFTDAASKRAKRGRSAPAVEPEPDWPVGDGDEDADIA